VRSTSLKGPRLLEGPNHDEWHPKTNLMDLDSNRTILSLIRGTISFTFNLFSLTFVIVLILKSLRPPAVDSAIVLIQLIFAEKVGQKSIIDLLTISFALSRPRRIGHILIRVCRNSKRCFIHLIVPVVLSTGFKRREFQRLLHDLNQIVIAGQKQTNVPCNQERSKNYRDYKCRMLPHRTQG